MNVIPTQNVWFDDTTTVAMGEAFDRTCKSLQIIGDAVSVRESSQRELSKPLRMASAILAASMSKH
jgi:hypothetical protein